MSRLPVGLSAALVATTLAGSWGIVFAAGGTHTALPHIFYVPVLLASLPFGLWGGLVAAAVATVLCGPAMPLDTATGQSQELANWLTRGGFFVLVGVLSGWSAMSLRRSFELGLVEQLHSELELVAPSEQPHVDTDWELRIRRALDEQAFRTVFQPILTLDDGRLLAVEALTRFEADQPYTPDVWFTRAAQVGLGTELELATIKNALEASHDLPGTVALTFNVSPETLADVRLLQLLAWHAGRPLIAEVTEHAAVEDYALLQDSLRALRSRGVRLAVDDVGAGFASLRHIVRLEPDFIKLDLSLTQHLGADPIRRPLAECLVEFANRTGITVIAEGLETPADLATWKDLGAHAAQGYLLGRPGSLEAAASAGVETGGPSPAIGLSPTATHGARVSRSIDGTDGG